MRTLILLFFSLSALAGEFDNILRFSSRLTEDRFVVANNLLNFREVKGESDWLDLSLTEGNGTVVFRAKTPTGYEDRPDALFSVCYDGSNSFDTVVMEARTYNFLCQWDDRGALEADRDCSASLLAEKEGYAGLGEDKDDWSFVPKKQGWCLEVTASNDFSLSAKQGGLNWDKPVELFFEADKATISKRLYITNAVLDANVVFTVARNEGSGEERIFYKFSLRPIRPLILVHGIRSSPVRATDPYTSFGAMRTKASSYGGFPPLVVFDFPWDSNQGSILSYCGKKEERGTLYGYSDGKCGNWALKPVFFAHSMGGLLLLEQMRNRDFYSFMGGSIFAGSPFCGSDLANFILCTTPGKIIKAGANVLDKVRTTDKNLTLLARGSDKVWQRLKNLRPHDNSLFLAGYQNSDVLVGRGDGVVNISSSALPLIAAWPGAVILPLYMEHSEMVEIDLPPSEKRRRTCEEITKILEH